jgi:hypothetical protein
MKTSYTFALETKTTMKTKITNTNAETIAKGFSNPFGMLIENKPEIRQAVAEHAKSIIAKLHAERKAKQN